jgi:hypothetical protein
VKRALTPVISRAELAQVVPPEKLGPNSPLRNGIARKHGRPLEHAEQVKVFKWAEENVEKYPALAWLFAVPNWFGVSTPIQGARAKAEGRKPGVPDMLFPERRGPYVGLAIEMKSPRHYPTREQRLWLAHLQKAGWLTDVCYSFEEARDLVLAYLSGTPTPPPRD